MKDWALIKVFGELCVAVTDIGSEWYGSSSILNSPWPRLHWYPFGILVKKAIFRSLPDEP